MAQGFRRLRGALGMGLTWAFGWALAGLCIGVLSLLTPGKMWDLFFSVFDAPLPALAMPGFIGGVLFSFVLGVAARHRKFSELSVGKFAAWGTLGGVLVSLIPALMVLLGLATPAGNLMVITLSIGIPLTLLSTASAATSLVIARKGEDRALLTQGEERDLLN